MQREKISIDQGFEALNLLRRLTPQEYQSRRSWLGRITDPNFDMGALNSVLTHTTYGSAIKHPVVATRLVSNVPYVGPLVLDGFDLLPMTVSGEKSILVSEMVRRDREEMILKGGSSFGARDLDDIWDLRQTISLAQWPVGVIGFAAGTVWEDKEDRQFVECISRDSASGWHRVCYWFDCQVDGSNRLLRRK